MKGSLILTFLISIIVLNFTANTGAQEGNMIRNGSFEIDTASDGMADYWQFSGNDSVVASWERDEGFDGMFSQKLICTDFESVSPSSHAMLAQVNTLNLEKGKWYRISFGAKQSRIPGRSIQVAISNMKDWHNCGLSVAFRATGEWKRYEFAFQSTETISDNVRLQFWYMSTGTLWLDDVSLEPSEPVARKFSELALPSDSVNLVSNSSFECGTSGWGSIADIPGWGGNLNRIVGEIDENTSKFNGSSLKIELTPGKTPVYYFDYFLMYRFPVKAPFLANRGWINLEPDNDYVLSVYMKSSEKTGLRGKLSIRQSFRGSISKTVNLTDEWDRYTLTFKPLSDQIFVAMGLDLEERDSGTVWIDGVQLESGSQATDYLPRTGLEASLESPLDRFLPYGTKPEMIVSVFNSSEKLHSAKLHAQITDFDEAVVYEEELSLEAPAGEKVRVAIHPEIAKKGFYRLHLQLDGRPALTRPVRFAIIDPYDKRDSLFGMNHAYPWPHLLELSKDIGLRWFRDWSLKWHDVEPEKGKFDFTEADQQIDRVLQHDLNVLPLLPFPSSNWSSSAGPDVESGDRYPASRERIAYMPGNMDDFANYVRRTIEYYRDRLHVWEIMNEPVYTDYSLPKEKGYGVEDYVNLLRVAYRAVKDADPEAFVIGGIAGGPDLYTRDFIELGGLQWVDALNLHTYPGLIMPEYYEEPMRQLQERMSAAGFNKPIWFTEGAYYADDDLPYEPYTGNWLKILDNEIEAAEWQIKFNVILMTYGVEKFIYHSGTPGSLNNESLSGIFFEWGGAPRKMAVTQAALSNLLPPPVKSLGPVDAPETVKAYGFEAGGKNVIIAWVEDGSDPVKIPLAGKPWRVVDIQGNSIETEELILAERPIYLVADAPAELKI